MTPPAGLRRCLPALLALASCQNDGAGPVEFDIEGVHVYGELEFGRGKWGCFPCEEVRVHAYRGAQGWVLLGDAPPDSIDSGQIASATASELYVVSEVPPSSEPWTTKLWRWSAEEGWTAPWDTIGPMVRLRAASAAPNGEVWATDGVFLARWNGGSWGLVEELHEPGAIQCWENPGSVGCVCDSGIACADGLECQGSDRTCCEEGSSCEAIHESRRFWAMHASSNYFWINTVYGTLRFDGAEWLVDSQSDSVLGIMGTADGRAYVGASRNFYAPSQRVIEPAQLEPLGLPLVERDAVRGGGSVGSCGYVKLAGNVSQGIIVADERWESPDDVVPGCGVSSHQIDWFDGSEWVSIEDPASRVVSIEALSDGPVLRSSGAELSTFERGAWQAYTHEELVSLLQTIDPLGEGRRPTRMSLHAIFLRTPELD